MSNFHFQLKWQNIKCFFVLLFVSGIYWNTQAQESGTIESSCDYCNPNEIRQKLEGEGFFPIDIFIPGPITGEPPSFRPNISQNRNSSVTDYAEHQQFYFYDTEVFAEEILGEFLGSNVAVPDVNTKGYVTKNSTFCNEIVDFDEVKQLFNQGGTLSYWYHIWYPDRFAEDQSGVLYVKASLSDGTITPSSGGHEAYIQTMIGEMSSEANVYSFVHKDHQLGYMTSFYLLDSYVDNYFATPDIDTESENFTEVDMNNNPNPEKPCDVEGTTHNVLAPSSIPMRIPPGSVITFRIRAELWSSIGWGACSSFQTRDINNLLIKYRGSVNNVADPQNFIGYLNEKDAKAPPYCSVPSFNANEHYSIWLKRQSPISNGCVHTEFAYSYFQPYNPVCNGIGVLVSDFFSDSNPAGRYVFTGSNGANYECPPDINIEAFTYPDKMQVGMDRGTGQGNEDAIYFSFLNIPGNEDSREYFYTVFDYELSGEMVLYRWDKTLCIWRLSDGPTPSPIIETGDFLWAAWDAMREQAPDAGHTMLDVASLIPGAGTLADGTNAAWYALEGNYSEAGLSLIGVAAEMKVIRHGGNLILNAKKAGSYVACSLVGGGGNPVIRNSRQILKGFDNVYPQNQAVGVADNFWKWFRLDAGADIHKNFQNIPRLSEVWAHAHKEQIDNVKKIQLFNFISSLPTSQVNIFIDNAENMVSAWKVFDDSADSAILAWKTDFSMIKRLGDDMKDVDGLKNFVKQTTPGNNSGLLAWKYADDAYPSNPSTIFCFE